MEEVMSDPQGIHMENIEMGDSRWPASEGWIKMGQRVNEVEIHYVYNPKTDEYDDFKFTDQ